MLIKLLCGQEKNGILAWIRNLLLIAERSEGEDWRFKNTKEWRIYNGVVMGLYLYCVCGWLQASNMAIIKVLDSIR